MMMKRVLPSDFGVRFCPTDEELVHHYLKNKLIVDYQNLIIERDLYGEKATPWTLFTDDDPWQIPVDMLGTVRRNEKVIYVYTKLSHVGKTGMKNKIRTAGCGEWHGNATAAVKKNGVTIGRKRTFTFKTKEETTTVGQWTMYEYSLEGGDNDVVVCKIKVDVSKSSKGGRLVSRRNDINSTRYLLTESASSLDRVDLDDGSLNSLGRKRPATQLVGNNNTINNKKARSSSGVDSYFQDLLSEDTDQREEQIIVENINKMLANNDHHSTNSSVNGPMGAMIDQAAAKDDDSSAISSRFNSSVNVAALIGDNCSNPIHLDDFQEDDHRHHRFQLNTSSNYTINYQTDELPTVVMNYPSISTSSSFDAAALGVGDVSDNVPPAAADDLSVEHYPVDHLYFTTNKLFSDFSGHDQPVNVVIGEEKILDDQSIQQQCPTNIVKEDNKTDHTTTTCTSNDHESSPHCPTTMLHDDKEASAAVSDAIAVAPQDQDDDDDYIDHNPFLNPNLLLQDDIESVLKILNSDTENLAEEFCSNPKAFFETDT
ncbi:hypothetical protein ACH5RR_031671 [Cinchona calisaya]|uniref:NAC domain-containing protein n=1 Tax=Cinchona calisaya TaxID=153742 RepID=A0ABD2YJY5_9GENT